MFVFELLLMEEILHQLIWRIFHDFQALIHLRWLLGISEPSTVPWISTISYCFVPSRRRQRAQKFMAPRDMRKWCRRSGGLRWTETVETAQADSDLTRPGPPKRKFIWGKSAQDWNDLFLISVWLVPSIWGIPGRRYFKIFLDIVVSTMMFMRDDVGVPSLSETTVLSFCREN